MFFYPKHIDQGAIDALNAVGVNTRFVEMEIGDDLIASSDEMNITLISGVKLTRELIHFGGHIDAPKVWSSLDGDMVPTGVDQNQCPVCGYWMTRKDSPSDERQHDRTCSPQYRWTVEGVQVCQ